MNNCYNHECVHMLFNITFHSIFCNIKCCKNLRFWKHWGCFENWTVGDEQTEPPTELSDPMGQNQINSTPKPSARRSSLSSSPSSPAWSTSSPETRERSSAKWRWRRRTKACSRRRSDSTSWPRWGEPLVQCFTTEPVLNPARVPAEPR